jgi:hypothetical protein
MPLTGKFAWLSKPIKHVLGWGPPQIARDCWPRTFHTDNVCLSTATFITRKSLTFLFTISCLCVSSRWKTNEDRYHRFVRLISLYYVLLRNCFRRNHVNLWFDSFVTWDYCWLKISSLHGVLLLLCEYFDTSPSSLIIENLCRLFDPF